jgi:hypothetical protein
VHAAAAHAQRPVRQWLAVREVARRQRVAWQLRRDVAAFAWQAAVTDPIWRAVAAAAAARELGFEGAAMAAADGESAAARKYLKLQVTTRCLAVAWRHGRAPF